MPKAKVSSQKSPISHKNDHFPAKNANLQPKIPQKCKFLKNSIISRQNEPYPPKMQIYRQKYPKCKFMKKSIISRQNEPFHIKSTRFPAKNANFRQIYSISHKKCKFLKK